MSTLWKIKDTVRIARHTVLQELMRRSSTEDGNVLIDAIDICEVSPTVTLDMQFLPSWDLGVRSR